MKESGRGEDGYVQSRKCLCNDTGDNALEEEGIFVIKDAWTVGEEEVEVQQPARDKFGGCGKIVEEKGACEPRTTWSGRRSLRLWPESEERRTYRTSRRGRMPLGEVHQCLQTWKRNS